MRSALFRDAGYAVHVVEPHFKLANDRECNPECILTSSKWSHSIAIESKSGAGSSDDQLQRYQTLTTGDLAGAGLDIPKAALKAIDVLMIVPHDQYNGHLTHQDSIQSKLPIIAYDPDGGVFQLRRGKLQSEILNAGLELGLTVIWPPAPHDYIPFDADSTDLEIASAIVNSIVAQALGRRRSFQLIEICRDAIRFWDVLHPQQKKRLSKRIERVVENLLLVGFAGQFQFKNQKGGFTVEVTPAAQRAASADRNAFARRMNAMAEDALSAMGKKLQEEMDRGEKPLFKGTVLPPLKRRRRR